MFGPDVAKVTTSEISILEFTMLKQSFLRLATNPQAAASRVRPQRRRRLAAEALEVRSLLSATSWPGLMDPQVEREGNDRLDLSQEIGHIREGHGAEFVGSIGDAKGVSTDVDWLSFTLEVAGRVKITSLPGSDGAVSPVVLTLYGDQLAEFDPQTPLGHQWLGRRESTGSPARFDVQLEAGTYFVAVSGAGNRFFHPFLSDSGVPGLATGYGLSITVGSDSNSLPEALGTPSIRETNRIGSDTPSTAIDLGELVSAGHVQAEGVIGDDPFYNVVRSNPFARNPAADVDLYHFQIQGTGNFAIVAEVFAGRIGSSLDPALTLFRMDVDGSLQPIAENNNTLNPAESSNGMFPLFTDAVLFAGLSAGDYFLAVSSAGNDAESGPHTLFDPLVAHSGVNGDSTGAYALDVRVTADNVAPRVLATTPARGTPLYLPPTQVTIQFSEPVNAQILAYLESQESHDLTPRPVFVLGADGTRYFPRLQSYEVNSGIASFSMLDALPNGKFELHISGAEGLTDLAGLPIQGNHASGDHVVRFTVAGPVRGSEAGSSNWLNAMANDSAETAQELGVLFPRELQNGVTLIRDAATNAAQGLDTADHFHFELLQSRTLAFTLQNNGEIRGATLEVLDANGQPVSLLSLVDGTLRLGFLPSGRYVLRVSGWDATSSNEMTYQVGIRLLGASENPTPLTTGASAASGVHLRGSSAPILVTTPVSPDLHIASSSVAFVPSGLLQGLSAPPPGLPNVTTPAFTADTAIVRLFGFGDRDRLFALIDSALRRGTQAMEVTQAELTADELRDLLRRVPDRAELPETAAPEVDSSEETSTETGVFPEGEASTPDTTAVPPQRRPISRSPVRRRPARTPAIQESSSTEQPPAAISAPIALALASSLAHTLRDRARRESRESLAPL